MKGKILSLDVGTRKTGLAISDIDQTMAFMRPEIIHSSAEELILAIKELIKSESIHELLVGLPLSLSGEMKKIIEFTRLFRKLNLK